MASAESFAGGAKLWVDVRHVAQRRVRPRQ